MNFLPDLTEPVFDFCFDCRLRFLREDEAEAHYRLTGHQVGVIANDTYPLATEDQVYARGESA